MQVGAEEADEAVAELLVDGRLLVSDPERLLEELGLRGGYAEEFRKLGSILFIDECGNGVEFLGIGIHLGDQGVENLSRITGVVDLCEVDVVGVCGQRRGQPFVGLAAESQDIGLVAGDLAHRDIHVGQGHFRDRCRVTDDDVVGFEFAEIIVVIHTCGGQPPGRAEQTEKFKFHLREKIIGKTMMKICRKIRSFSENDKIQSDSRIL